MSLRGNLGAAAGCTAVLASVACTGILGSFTVSEAPLGGDTGVASLAVEPPILDFGAMDCGGSDGTPTTVTLRNTGTASTEWEAAIEGSDVFELSGTTHGLLAPGASITFAVTAKAVDEKVSHAGDVTVASLRVGPPGDVETSAVVQVKRTARGPQFTVLPGEVAFGKVAPSATATSLPLRLKNVGNAGATVRLSIEDATHFNVPQAGGQTTIAAGADVTTTAEFRGTVAQVYSTTASLEIVGNTKACLGSASTLALSATVSNDPLLASPGLLDFERNDCPGGKSTPAAQSITLSSGSAAGTPVNWAVKGDLPSLFTLDKTSGSFTAGTGTDTIVVTPKATTADSTSGDGSQSFVINLAAGGGESTLQLNQVIYGATLSTLIDDPRGKDDSTSLEFHVPKGEKKTRSLYLFNGGNAQVDIVPVLDTGRVFFAQPAGGGDAVTLTPSATDYQVVNVTFVADGNLYRDTLNLKPKGPMCAPQVPRIGLTGDSSSTTQIPTKPVTTTTKRPPLKG